MSILIKGMEMPISCYDCPVECEDYICGISKGGCTWTERPPHCPLVEIPPHGDLIDRRKLPLAFIDITDLPTDRCLPVYLQEDVDDAPTIIESEGE